MRNLFLFGFIMSLFSCKSQNQLPTVPHVDLEKYSGKWFEISSITIGPQKGCSCTYAEYTPNKKGYIEVRNFCIKNNKPSGITGKAFVEPNSGNARLKVQFFWPFKGKYYIIALADDYSYAMVGHPNRDNLWILSRRNQMEESTYKMLLGRATELGFDISRLNKTKHDCQ